MNRAAEIQQLRSRNRELETENAVLRSENKLLRSRLGPAVWRLDGRRAEEFVQQLIGGQLQPGSAPYDLILPNGRTFEIKFCNLNEAVPGKITHRWNWAHILGSNRGKNFDRLLLISLQDPQYCEHYDDPESPFVIFDVPFKDVPGLLESDNSIRTSTHPFKFRRTVHRKLMCSYQISRKRLVQRYGSKV